jgi:hypothetical protein
MERGHSRNPLPHDPGGGIFRPMDLSIVPTSQTELAAAYLQLAVTLGLVVLCLILNRRFHRRYFGLWSVAWALYALRLVAIIVFLLTTNPVWLFWHQVTTGWTAAALLWAALVFSQRISWKPVYASVAFFPVIWSFVAIYVLDHFLWAAGPMVAFLSATTAAAGWAFLRYDRMVRSPSGRFLAVVLFLWALHHLDYPLLRAQGAWNPWGYYLDIVFEIGLGLGILFLVLEDLEQGLRSLTSLSGELQGGLAGDEPMAEAMLRRALSLRGVQGSALWIANATGGRFVQGAGVAALWPFEGAPDAALRGAGRVKQEGVPHVTRGTGAGRSLADQYGYTAALPVLGDDGVLGALVVVGEARDPFTVLDNRFLLAFGQQVGAALANEELHHDLQERTEELERLQTRMVHQSVLSPSAATLRWRPRSTVRRLCWARASRVFAASPVTCVHGRWTTWVCCLRSGRLLVTSRERTVSVSFSRRKPSCHRSGQTWRRPSTGRCRRLFPTRRGMEPENAWTSI